MCGWPSHTHRHFLLACPAFVSQLPGPCGRVQPMGDPDRSLQGGLRNRPRHLFSRLRPCGLCGDCSFILHLRSWLLSYSSALTEFWDPLPPLSFLDVWLAQLTISSPGVLHHPLLISLNLGSTFLITPFLLSKCPFWTFHLFLANILPDTPMDQLSLRLIR